MAIAGLAATHAGGAWPLEAAVAPLKRTPGARVRLALNAYSFHRPLVAGAMTLEDVVEYCARQGLESLDATGYYFPGYPSAPADEYVYRLKRKAFLNGIAIHGTGVRNDFSLPDRAARLGEVQMVQHWIEVAQKLGASVVRIFTGRRVPEGYSFDQVLAWMVPHLRECADYGARHGVVVAIQNHDDFLKTAAEVIRVIEAVDSEWFGLILDVGSLRRGDPYAEIEALAPYAVSWQLKEQVWYGDRPAPVDLKRIKQIIERAGYRGVLPLETLGEGDPKTKVADFLQRVRAVFGGA
jgi:sugar phosphate isomerase/epimerase